MRTSKSVLFSYNSSFSYNISTTVLTQLIQNSLLLYSQHFITPVAVTTDKGMLYVSHIA